MDPRWRQSCRTATCSVRIAASLHGIQALIALGGDGSMNLATQLMARGLPRVIGVPKTIDNDLPGTEVTFGFETAVATATDALDKLHTTAQSHQRVMVVEVMGRYAGWIALHAGIAGGADVILIPEIPYDIAAVAEKIEQRYERGRPPEQSPHLACGVPLAKLSRPQGRHDACQRSARARARRTS